MRKYALRGDTFSEGIRPRYAMGSQNRCMGGRALEVQKYVRGRDRRVLLGSRVLPSTHVAVAELARREKRSVSSLVNEAVQRLLAERAVR